LLKDGLADSQREFVRHFLGTREETFFADMSQLINASSESMLELRTLRLQKEESDRQSAKLRDTMRTTVGNTMGKVMQAAFGKKVTMPGQTLNPTSEEFVPMTSGLAPGGTAQQQIVEAPKDDDFFDQMKDEGNITLVLSVLQGMCEGHNTVLQNYLRVQPDNISSTDLVSMCTNFLEVATLDIHE
jgi:nicotinamidase-related amidase